MNVGNELNARAFQLAAVANHSLCIDLKLLEEARIGSNQRIVFEVLIEGRRNGSIDVDTLHGFLMTLFNSFTQSRNTLLQFFLVILLLLSQEKFVQLKTAASVTQSVVIDTTEKLRSKGVLVAHLEEMLNAVEAFMVVKHEEVLVLLLFWHVPEAVQGVEGSQLPRRNTLRHTLVPLKRGRAHQLRRLVGRERLFPAFSEDVELALVEDAVLLLHGQLDIEQVKQWLQLHPIGRIYNPFHSLKPAKIPFISDPPKMFSREGQFERFIGIAKWRRMNDFEYNKQIGPKQMSNTYLDDFMDKMITVPNDINRYLRLIRKLDKRVQEVQAALKPLQDKFLAQAKELRERKGELPAQMKADYDVILRKQKELHGYAKEKKEIADQLYSEVREYQEMLANELKNKYKEKPEQEILKRKKMKLDATKFNQPNKKEDFYYDSKDPQYCYCGGASFGEMVACQNPYCEREWFHTSCIEEKNLPEKWYCSDCQKQKDKTKNPTSRGYFVNKDGSTA